MTVSVLRPALLSDDPEQVSWIKRTLWKCRFINDTVSSVTFSETVNLWEIVKMMCHVFRSSCCGFVSVHPYCAGAFSFMMLCLLSVSLSVWLHKISLGPDGVLPLRVRICIYIGSQCFHMGRLCASTNEHGPVLADLQISNIFKSNRYSFSRTNNVNCLYVNFFFMPEYDEAVDLEDG